MSLSQLLSTLSFLCPPTICWHHSGWMFDFSSWSNFIYISQIMVVVIVDTFQSGGGLKGQLRSFIKKFWDHCSTKRVQVSTICWSEIGLKNLELDLPLIIPSTLCKAPQHDATTTMPDSVVWKLHLDSFSLIQSSSHLVIKLFWGRHLARPWRQLQVSVELEGVAFF